MKTFEHNMLRAKHGNLPIMFGVAAALGCGAPQGSIESTQGLYAGKLIARDAPIEVHTEEPTKDAKDPGRSSVITIHPGESWYKYRAEWLGLSTSQARTRDEAIDGQKPPPNFWDEQTAVEAAGLWSGLCNDCHGGRRRASEAKLIPSPAEKWGAEGGLFFGRSRRYQDVFRTIYSGGEPAPDPKRPAMPAWGDKISREQIWSIIYFIEYFSGGIEGRFPPSLYPRQQN